MIRLTCSKVRNELSLSPDQRLFRDDGVDSEKEKWETSSEIREKSVW